MGRWSGCRCGCSPCSALGSFPWCMAPSPGTQTGLTCQEPLINSNLGAADTLQVASGKPSRLAEGQIPQEMSNPNRNHIPLPGVWEDGWRVLAGNRRLCYFKPPARRLSGDRASGGSRSFLFPGQGQLVKGHVWFLKCRYRFLGQRGMPQRARETGDGNRQ